VRSDGQQEPTLTSRVVCGVSSVHAAGFLVFEAHAAVSAASASSAAARRRHGVVVIPAHHGRKP
jgi:hypothetical protein